MFPQVTQAPTERSIGSFYWSSVRDGFAAFGSNIFQGARKDGRGNEPVGSCAMCDARSTGPRALEGKNR